MSGDAIHVETTEEIVVVETDDQAVQIEVVESPTVVEVSGIGLQGPVGAAGPQNLFVQSVDPGSTAFPYAWFELNQDDTVKTLWIYTP